MKLITEPPSEREPFMIFDREMYIILLNGKEIGKEREKSGSGRKKVGGKLNIYKNRNGINI